MDVMRSGMMIIFICSYNFQNHLLTMSPFLHSLINYLIKICSVLLLPMLLADSVFAQPSTDLTLDRIFLQREFQVERMAQTRWLDSGEAYTVLEPSDDYEEAVDLVRYETLSGERSLLIPAAQLIPEGSSSPLQIEDYHWSADKQQLLIFTNSKRVWRRNTRGDYWVLQRKNGQLHQLGKDLPESSLMFAKFSPQGDRVAYVSKHNLYVEKIADGSRTALTQDGSSTLINGTFDWAYEEEFSCRDGFRWSPDGNHIAFWQVDAAGIRDFLMINNTDSVYSHVIPVQYPKVGETPSSCRIGVVAANGSQINWMQIPGDPQQHYLPRMLWHPDSRQILVQQLNRKQNTLMLWMCQASNGQAVNFYTEKEEAWIDCVENIQWLKKGKSFSWMSEKSGWRQGYSIDLTKGDILPLSPTEFDIMSIEGWESKHQGFYGIASPDDPTQRYLYHFPAKLKGESQRITPASQTGTHSYDISPDGRFAFHTWSNVHQPAQIELIRLPDHQPIRRLVDNASLEEKIKQLTLTKSDFFQITSADGVQMEGHCFYPADFDSSKQYPVLFYVYGEPWGQTAKDSWGGTRSMWHRMLAQQGYLVMTVDNRGTPSPKGRVWRKSIYRKIGVINSHDQAMALKEILKWPFVDEDRIAVWGWSGGGSMTLNLLFRYPELYGTGMSVAPVSNQLYYDNIYQERYMGLPSENLKDFVEGSPITYAKHLEGNLLLVHGTGDDNVHYQNAEAVINELILHNKQFQVMPYPNRSHGIYEGSNTTRHLYTLLTQYLKRNCPPGPR